MFSTFLNHLDRTIDAVPACVSRSGLKPRRARDASSKPAFCQHAVRRTSIPTLVDPMLGCGDMAHDAFESAILSMMKFLTSSQRLQVLEYVRVMYENSRIAPSQTPVTAPSCTSNGAGKEPPAKVAKRRKKQPSWKCPVCQDTFNIAQDRASHLARKHQSCLCNECGAVLTREDYRAHFAKHADNKVSTNLGMNFTSWPNEPDRLFDECWPRVFQGGLCSRK